MISTAPRLQDILPSATLALTAKAKELKSKGHPVISLAAGEPDFPVPPVAQEAIIEALKSGFTKYTPTSGMPELRQAVVRKVERDQGLKVQEANVVISCGAKHSLYNLIQVLCSPGDDVLLPRPYWVSYPEMVKLAGARPVYVDMPDDFLMTAERIEKAITPKSRVLVLNSPSNPTGAVLSESEIRKIAGLVVKKNLFCISDEIYEYYVFDGQKHFSVASFVPNFTDRVAIVNGMSKSYAMTGLRIGYTVTHPEIVKKIGILQDHSTSNPVSLSQKAAIAAMGLGEDFTRNLRVTFEKKRDLITGLLGSIPKLKVFRASGAFYAWVSVKETGMTPQVFADRLLQEKFVAAIPGEGFGAPEHVRFSFAASVEDIQEGCKRIKDWLEKI